MNRKPAKPSQSTPSKNHSIQRQLLTSLLITLPIIWIFSTILINRAMINEVNEINDTQMTQLARYLIVLSEVESKNNLKTNKPKLLNLAQITQLNLGFSEEGDMGFAIWDKKGQLIMADEAGKNFQFKELAHSADLSNIQSTKLDKSQRGFVGDVAHFPFWNTLIRSNQSRSESEYWRYFYINNTKDSLVAVGQNNEERQEVINNAITTQFLNMLLGLLTFSILTIYFIKKSFLPLTKVSKKLNQRHATDDSPILDTVPNEIQPLVNSLNSLFVKMSETLAREQRFTADASHELRSPITSLKLQADVLEQDILQMHLSDSDEYKLFKQMKKMQSGIQRSNHLIEQLLILSKLEPQQKLKPDTINKIDWLNLSNEILNSVNLQARENNINLKRKVLCADQKVLPIKGNKILLGILLRNLLDNAIRYCSIGLSEKDPPEVTLLLDKSSITVSDNGLGVPEEDLLRLSERFFRPAGQSQKGTGLGLSIVKRIADLHGFTVIIENRIEKEKIVGFEVKIQAVQ